MAADHADDAAFADDDEVSVLVVELVDESAGAGIGILGDFVDEGSEVESMDLLKFLASLGAFENVGTDTQHPGHLQRCSAWEPAEALGRPPPAARRDRGPHDPCREEITNAAADLQAFCARKDRKKSPDR